jgi:hypothetical protein
LAKTLDKIGDLPIPPIFYEWAINFARLLNNQAMIVISFLYRLLSIVFYLEQAHQLCLWPAKDLKDLVDLCPPIEP